jgi:adenylate cyclase
MKSCVFAIFCLIPFSFFANTTHINQQQKIAAKLMFELKDYDSAWFILNKTLTASQESEFKSGEALANYYLGLWHIHFNNFYKAVPYIQNAKKIYEIQKDNEGLSKCYLQLGVVHYAEKKYAEALEFFNAGLEKIVTQANNPLETRLYYLTGLCYLELNELKEAEIRLKKAYQYFQIHNEQHLNECRIGLADLYLKKGELNNAGIYYQQALDWFDSANKIEGKSMAYLGLGNVYLNMRDYINAEKYLSLSYQIGYALSAEKALSNLIELHVNQNNHKQAFYYLEKYQFLKDSIMSAENMQAIFSLQNDLQLSQKQAQIEILEKSHEIQRRTNLALVGGGLLFVLLSIVMLNRYMFEKKTKEIIKNEQHQSEKLLLNILPKETANELKTYGKAFAKRHEEVHVMFTDIKNFSIITRSMSAEELVKELDYCFSGFDIIINKYGLEKIKTIGDAYLCVGGLSSSDKGNAIQTVEAALEMQAFLKSSDNDSNKQSMFEIRTGIHSGPVVAGVVGTNKFAYDIWGNTVNMAARMEQSSESGMINISEQTYLKVKDYFQCKSRGKIAAKNVGEINMYYVLDKI